MDFGDRQEDLVARIPGLWKFKDGRKAAQAEFGILVGLTETGVPCPRPLALEEPEASERPFFLMSWVEGAPVLAPDDPEGFLDRYAQLVATIHQVREPRGVPRRDFSIPWLTSTMDDDLREAELVEWMERLKPTRCNEPCLVHGDLWPGNVIWKDGEVAAVIDWEDCGIGEPLFDLAIARQDLMWLLGEQAIGGLAERYLAKHPIDAHDLPFWDLLAAHRSISFVRECAPAYEAMGMSHMNTERILAQHQRFTELALAAAKASV